MKPSNLLTPQQAAEVLGLSDRRVQQLCRQGIIGKRTGGRYVIEKGELERYKRIHALVKPGPKPKKPR